MSDKPISVGDLVVVVRDCCGRYLGRTYRVGNIEREMCFCYCGFSSIGTQAAPDAETWGAPLPWLKRIPPLDELEGEKRDEEITA